MALRDAHCDAKILSIMTRTLGGAAKFRLDSSIMFAHRLVSCFVRTAVAVMFAFMSVFHGPVMTFAKAAPAHHAIGVAHPAHHHGATPQQRSADPVTVPACDGFGCLLVVDSLAVRLPAAAFNLIGKLAPGIVRPMLAADIEPAIPPPRLQV